MSLALLRLMRLYYSVPLAAGFIVILSYLTGGNLVSIFDKVVLSFFSLLSIISASYVFNDVCDIEIDKINCPSRMLAAGRIRRKAEKVQAGQSWSGGKNIRCDTCSSKCFDDILKKTRH